MSPTYNELLWPASEALKQTRELTRDDYQGLAACFNSWDKDDSWLGTFTHGTPYTEERVQRRIDNTKVVANWIVDDGEGVRAYMNMDGHWSDADADYIPLLGADPDYHGRGFGKALLLTGLMKTFERGKRRLDLYTWSGNLKAIPLYKKVGFFWHPKTTVLMSNFIPAVLGTNLFSEFFKETCWYDSLTFEMTQAEDQEIDEYGMRGFHYYFEKDEDNSIKILIDRFAKEILGFEYKKDGKTLAVRLVATPHQLVDGLDKPIAKFLVNNEWNETLDIELELVETHKIKVSELASTLRARVGPGETIEVDLGFEIGDSPRNLDGDTNEERTEAYFTSRLSVDGVGNCQLGTGFALRPAISAVVETTFVDLSDMRAQTGTIPVLIHLWNDNDQEIDLSIAVATDNIQPVNEYGLKLSPQCGGILELGINSLEIPETTLLKIPISIHVKNTGLYMKPLTVSIPAFKEPGGLSYHDERLQRWVLQTRLVRTEVGDTDGRLLLVMKDEETGRSSGYYGPIVSVGMPFPDEESEFWQKKHDIVRPEFGNWGCKLVLEHTSQTEKPGIKLTREYECWADRKEIATTVRLTNTGTIARDDLGIKFASWTSDIFRGRVSFCSNKTVSSMQDATLRGVGDLLAPEEPEHAARWWLATRDHAIPRGLLWNPSDFQRINVRQNNVPILIRRPIALQAGESISFSPVILTMGIASPIAMENLWRKRFGQSTFETPLPEDFTSISSYSIGLKTTVDNPLNLQLPLVNLNLGDPMLQYMNNTDSEYSAQATLDQIAGTDTTLKKMEKGANEISNVRSDQIQTQFLSHLSVNYEKSGMHRVARIPTLGWRKAPGTDREVVEEMEEDGLSVWRISNGVLEFKIAPTHGAALYHLSELNGNNVLFSRFPRKDAHGTTTGLVGGILPILGSRSWEGLSNNQLLSLAWQTEPIKNGEWFGARMTCDFSNHPKTPWLAASMTHWTMEELPLVLHSFELRSTLNSKRKVSAALDVRLDDSRQRWISAANELMIRNEPSDIGMQYDLKSDAPWVGQRTQQDQNDESKMLIAHVIGSRHNEMSFITHGRTHSFMRAADQKLISKDRPCRFNLVSILADSPDSVSAFAHSLNNVLDFVPSK